MKIVQNQIDFSLFQHFTEHENCFECDATPLTFYWNLPHQLSRLRDIHREYHRIFNSLIKFSCLRYCCVYTFRVLKNSLWTKKARSNVGTMEKARRTFRSGKVFSAPRHLSQFSRKKLNYSGMKKESGWQRLNFPEFITQINILLMMQRLRRAPSSSRPPQNANKLCGAILAGTINLCNKKMWQIFNFRTA